MPVKQIKIDDNYISAHFRYSRRARYLSIRINTSNEIDVVLPYGYKLERAESFLDQKSGWIRKHIKKIPDFSYSYLGNQLQVQQDFNLFIKEHKIELEENKLLITSPAGSMETPVKLFELWLRLRAKQYLTLRTRELSIKHNFNYKNITIKGQKTRWGSCSAKKNLSFNYRLVKLRKEIIDYVIIHELCHLKELNHSVKFWQLVENILPDYKSLKKELKQQGVL